MEVVLAHSGQAASSYRVHLFRRALIHSTQEYRRRALQPVTEIVATRFEFARATSQWVC